MKPLFFILLATLSIPAHAASLQEIFQQIADTTGTGNGNGHTVTHLTGRLNVTREVNRLNKEVNPAHPDRNDCRFDINADIEGGLKELRGFDENKTAARLAGLNQKGLIQEIVYSSWDGQSGDAEYCTKSTMKVFGVDGSVLTFDLDQTD